MLQRGSHRVRVRVVGVVDHEPAAGQVELLPAPGREPDRGRPGVRAVERKPEGGVGVERGQRVQSMVALREGELELDLAAVDSEPPDVVLQLDVGRVEAAKLDVVAVEVRL